jgi:hypothetical protein
LEASAGGSGEAIAFIEGALRAYQDRLRGEPDLGGKYRAIVCCLRSALEVLRGATPLSPEDARREAIAWLVIALRSA